MQSAGDGYVKNIKIKNFKPIRFAISNNDEKNDEIKMAEFILSILMSFLGTIGINYICTLSAGTDFSNSVLSISVFAVIYALEAYTLKNIFLEYREAVKTREIMRQKEAELVESFAESKIAVGSDFIVETGAGDGGDNAVYSKHRIPSAVKELVRRIRYAVILAFLFALSFIMGWQIKANGMTESGFAGKGKIVILAVMLGIAVFPFSYALFEALSGCYRGRRNIFEGWNSFGVRDAYAGNRAVSDGGRAGMVIGSGRLFAVCMSVIFLCWIPVFLAYYPAVMAYDFNIQSLQASWGPPYFSAHHPIAHTLLIWICFEIGEALGSLQIGMAFYSIFQMLLLSAALAYAVTFIYRLCHSKWAVVLSLLFFAVFPYNSILSISVTKDVIFAALFLVFMLLIMERNFFSYRWNNRRKRKLLNMLTFLDGFAMLLFRNNAIYAFIAFSIIYILLSKGKERLRIIILCALIALSGKLALEGLVTCCGYFGKGSSAEMYSVPMQQFARVGYYHGYLNGNEMDPETYEMIDYYVSHEVWEGYNPPIADSVKIYVSAFQYDKWKADMPAVFKTWAKVGMRYPNEYIDAFLCLTNGYWFLDDVTWAENLGFGLEERKGALFTFNASVSEAQPDGIPNESKFPALERALEELVSNNCFYKWPVLSNLFKPAFYCWALFICAIGFLYQRRKAEFLMTIFPFMYLGTLLLGPVVIVRYIMPIMIFVPVLITLLLCRHEK